MLNKDHRMKSRLNFRFAGDQDIPALVSLINAAYQVEKFFKINERTHSAEVQAHLQSGRFLLLEDEQGIAGSVYVELRGDRGYFGMLSVDPGRQRSGIGRRLIAAAEEFCREQGCRFMELSVVNLRTELPPIYAKFGYRVFGSAPFPADEMPVSQPCSFTLMEKELGHST
jgi:GNAT superfamily N-acetyltransferase